MIEIESTKNIKAKDVYDLNTERATFKVSNENILSDKISVIRYEDDDFYCIELSNDSSSKDLLSLLDSDFQNFLTWKENSIDYELLLPFDTITGNDFFDSFSTVFYIEKHKEQAYLKILLAQDFWIENTEWSKYSTFYLYEKLIEMGKVRDFGNITILEGEDDTEELVRILFRADLSENINDFIKKSFDSLSVIAQELEKFINTQIWSDDFEKDEPKFSSELLLPLMRKMNFDNVQYIHGKREYGRDFLFSEVNKFGESIYYGMQVKTGDISGKVNSEIDMLIEQLNDAFSMPFYLLGNKNSHYISSFIIAISGRFMENAKEKIMHKVPDELSGNVFFWDKEKLMELIERNWSK